jgi:hypothetical protein
VITQLVSHRPGCNLGFQTLCPVLFPPICCLFLTWRIISSYVINPLLDKDRGMRSLSQMAPSDLKRIWVMPTC